MTYSNLQIFIVELVGTFILVVFATGSIVYDVQIGEPYGI
jgi:aquaporin Z